MIILPTGSNEEISHWITPKNVMTAITEPDPKNIAKKVARIDPGISLVRRAAVKAADKIIPARTNTPSQVGAVST